MSNQHSRASSVGNTTKSLLYLRCWTLIVMWVNKRLIYHPPRQFNFIKVLLLLTSSELTRPRHVAFSLSNSICSSSSPQTTITTPSRWCWFRSNFPPRPNQNSLSLASGAASKRGARVLRTRISRSWFRKTSSIYRLVGAGWSSAGAVTAQSSIVDKLAER